MMIQNAESRAFVEGAINALSIGRTAEYRAHLERLLELAYMLGHADGAIAATTQGREKLSVSSCGYPLPEFGWPEAPNEPRSARR